MKRFKCNKCGSDEVFIEQGEIHCGLYCSDCGKWIAWLNEEQKRLAERYIKIKEKEINGDNINE